MAIETTRPVGCQSRSIMAFRASVMLRSSRLPNPADLPADSAPNLAALAAVLAAAFGLKALDVFAALDLHHDPRFFFQPVLRDHDCDRFADRFARRISEQAGRANLFSGWPWRTGQSKKTVSSPSECGCTNA